MIKVDNIDFKGKFRYLNDTICALHQIPIFEVPKDKASKELIVFAEKSNFLNTLKRDRDVFLHHKIETPSQTKFQRSLFLSKLFNRRKLNINEACKENLTIVFEHKKANKVQNAEMCEIHISLPINNDTPQNLDRFEKILENNANIDLMRKKAYQIFPEDTHRLIMLQTDTSKGWIEFWTGEKNAFDTLDRLMIAFYQQMTDMSKKTLYAITKNRLGL